MSEQEYEEVIDEVEEFIPGRDGFVESEFGVPPISWEGVRVGTSFDYELLEHAEGQAYSYEPQREMGSGRIKYFMKDGKPTKNARMQYVVTMQTNLKDHDLTSDNHQARVAEAGLEDDGKRRLYIKGKENTEAFLEAVKAVAKAPEIGGRGTVTLVKRKPNPGFKATPIFSVTYTSPSPL
jgi:hypothetical protein